MNKVVLTRTIALIGLVVCVLGLAFKINEIMNRPYKRDLSRPRGNVGESMLYAFTLGMAPWGKESTRIHWIAYIRGILFHVGVFMAFAVFFVSPWLAAVPLLLSGLAVLVTASMACFIYSGSD